jgi:hypothetical protein
VQPNTDVTVSGGGTVYLFHLESNDAHDWVEEHVQLESWQRLGSAFAVEHRYAGPLIEGMVGDGLRVEVRS